MAGERPDQWGRFFSTLDNKQVELCVRVNLLKHNKAWFYFELDQLLFYFFCILSLHVTKRSCHNQKLSHVFVGLFPIGRSSSSL